MNKDEAKQLALTTMTIERNRCLIEKSEANQKVAEQLTIAMEIISKLQ